MNFAPQDISGPSQTWFVRNATFLEGDFFAQMSAFGTDPGEVHDDWLISSSLDLSSSSEATLSFLSVVGFGDGSALSVLVSTDYSGSGDPLVATWTPLPFTTPNSPSGFSSVTPSGDIDLGAFLTSNTHIAFRYQGTECGGCNTDQTYEIDNVSITEMAAEPPPAPNEILLSKQGDLRVATYNVALSDGPAGQILTDAASGSDPEMRSIAEVIQRVNPDIILLNEFDYEGSGTALADFNTNYLNVSQNGAPPTNYPHQFIAPSNTGLDSGFDLDNDGTASGDAGDSFGFGNYPGQFGMAILSKYPVDIPNVRTFQLFEWVDMPGNLIPNGFFSASEISALRLSSKSHWDLPITVGSRTVHILASHPTPPVFDGPEDRNGRRNHDEIRLWADYVTPGSDLYIVDDNGVSGGLGTNRYFIVLGDQNADPDEGDGFPGAIDQLLANANIDNSIEPVGNLLDPSDTATFGLRADYVLPSTFGFSILQGAVVAPDPSQPLVSAVTASDHRLVYLDLLFDLDDDRLSDDVETNTGVFVDENDTGTNPNNPDSDGDGVEDGREVELGLDPNDATSTLPLASSAAVSLTVFLLGLVYASHYKNNIPSN